MKYRLFSEREALKKGDFPPAPSLRTFAPHLRRNIIHILEETLGLYYVDRTGFGEPVETTNLWVQFDRVMHRESEEYANWTDQHRHWNSRQLILNYIAEASNKGVLDILDVGVAIVDQMARPLQQQNSDSFQAWDIRLSADDGLSEIDLRLREHGTVYRVADGAIIVSTDDFTHESVIVPALQVLGESGFENASREFHEALEAYRNARYDIVLTKANHAFESTMKIIAGKMGWTYDEKATAAPMLELLFKNGLLPTMHEAPLRHMIEMMKCDLPRLRNTMPSAGHGAGEKDADIPEPFAVYAISAAAANIRLLVESYRLRRKNSGR